MSITGRVVSGPAGLLARRPWLRVPGLLVAAFDGPSLGPHTLARTDPKWHFDANGVLQEAADGEPGFGPDGLTIDPQRTNDLDADEYRDFSEWQDQGASVSQDSVGIDGTSNSGTTFTDDDADNAEYRQVIKTVSDDSAKRTSTFYLKNDGDTSIFPNVETNYTGGSSILEWVWINKDTGAGQEFSGRDSGEFEITSPATGWWRVAVTLANNGSGNDKYTLRIRPASATVIGTLDNAATGSSVFDWVNFEEDDYGTRPIPGATTRNADIVSGDMPSIFGSRAGVIAFDCTPFAAAMGTFFAYGSYVDADNYTAILHDGDDWIARRRVSGVNHDATIAHSYTPGTTDRIVGRFNDDHCAIFVNGTKGSDNADTITLQRAAGYQVGADGNSGNVGSWSVQRFRKWDGARFITDALAASM